MSSTPPSEEHGPVVEKYARLAERYDARWPSYIEATARETLARLSVRPTGSVLDVGCGTGALLHQLGRAYPQARLVGIDPVPEMLAVARRRLPPPVELREGWAEGLPFDDESFDAVVSCNVFHYIRRPVAALREMGRVLRPGGQLVITDWCGDYLLCRILDWHLRLFSPAHVKVYRERECLRLLQEAGYPQASIERYRIGWLWGLMTVGATKQAS